MSSHQIHFGRKFYLDKKRGYWISTDYPRIRAHQWVWTNFHGLIPKGYHIHHKNEDKSNNSIENLELIERSRHLRHHLSDPRRKKVARENVERIRHLTKKWHSSEEGRAWHRLHALKNKFGEGELRDYTCQKCFKPYQSKIQAIGRTRFCTNACKSAWRRQKGIDHVIRNCETCYKEFMCNKYSKTRTCSRKCAGVLRSKERYTTCLHTKVDNIH